MPTSPATLSSPAKAAGSSVAVASAHPSLQANSLSNTIAEQRRHGQRVLLRVRANMLINNKAQEAEVVPVLTLSVNPAGGMLVSPRNLAAQTRFVLEHAGTKEKIECRVVSMPKHSPEGFHVAVAFDAPSPQFWRVAFPPEDWKPHDDL